MKADNYTKGFFALFLVFFATVSIAHNKVVVIPLGGDEPVYEVGKTGPAGGIVFHITDGGQHGLEASHEDQSIGASWGCDGNDVLEVVNLPNAATVDPNTGAHNTRWLRNCFGAAYLASLYRGPNGITSDWYLPNKEELDLLFNQKDVVGGFAGDVYWSSSENSISDAWFQSFANGNQVDTNKSFALRVRAVRAF